jgi:TonB family protein
MMLLGLISLLILIPLLPLRAQSTEPESDSMMFERIDQMPAPVIPLESLIQYPEYARKNRIEGEITLQALVEKDGSVSKVHMFINDVDTSLQHEAVRVMKAARFNPAIVEGEPEPMRIWVTDTLTFRLPNLGSDSSRHEWPSK